jgi:hypothetical protein
MEPTSMGLTAFLAADVIASIAVAAWLGLRGADSRSGWDR